MALPPLFPELTMTDALANNRINIRALRYFQALAEELHFGRAAERLNISQPPLSTQIKELEETLETKLFERTSRKVVLTRAGQVLKTEVRQTIRTWTGAYESSLSISKLPNYGPAQLISPLTATSCPTLKPIFVISLLRQNRWRWPYRKTIRSAS